MYRQKDKYIPMFPPFLISRFTDGVSGNVYRKENKGEKMQLGFFGVRNQYETPDIQALSTCI